MKIRWVKGSALCRIYARDAQSKRAKNMRAMTLTDVWVIIFALIILMIRFNGDERNKEHYKV